MSAPLPARTRRIYKSLPDLRIDAITSLLVWAKTVRLDASRQIVLNTDLLASEKASHLEYGYVDLDSF